MSQDKSIAELVADLRNKLAAIQLSAECMASDYPFIVGEIVGSVGEATELCRAILAQNAPPTGGESQKLQVDKPVAKN